MWDMATRETVRMFTGHTDDVRTLAISPDGLYLASTHKPRASRVPYSTLHRTAGSKDTTTKLWDISSGKELFAWAGHGQRLQSVKFTPSGRYVLTNGWDGTLRVWDCTNGLMVALLNDVECFAVMPNSNAIAVFTYSGQHMYIPYKLIGEAIQR